jgi:kinesin family protein 11
MAAPASRPASRPALSTSRAPSSASSSQPSRSSQPAPAIDADDAAPLQRRPVRTDTATDGNIQVVVRCRGRSAREAAEQVIVSSEGAKSSELTIKVGPAPPTGAGAVPAEPPTRTYPFDLVFGPDADQALLYQEVVAPMLEEVLHGYNCTLFAYGQTGTGKT